MDLRLQHTSDIVAPDIVLPGSKSITNRALIINALSECPTCIEGTASCDDTRAIIEALDGRLQSTVDVGPAGTAMRFLTAYFASKPDVSLTLTGDKRMLCRPIRPLVMALTVLGADIAYQGKEGYPPLLITGKHLNGGDIEIRGDISSQFISALMIVGPTLRGGLNIRLTGEIVSRPYIEMTGEVMRHFGVDVRVTENLITIPERTYRAPKSFCVEADWSSASYFYELVALSGVRDIKLSGLRPTGKSAQGDAAAAELFREFGVYTSFADGCALISAESNEYDGNGREMLLLNLSSTPDLVPAMVVTACLKNRQFRYYGIHNLRIKESDRISTLASEMRRLGYPLHCDADSISWKGERCQEEVAPVICTHSDHRLAMAFAPAVILYEGLVISDALVVNKSFPGFWSEIRKLGIKSEVV